MSMSTYVMGFRPPDEKFKKFAAIWKQCQEAGVEPPDEVSKFFEHTDPDPQGVEVRLPEGNAKNACVFDWTDGDMQQGIEVNVTKLPKDVTILRFVNSF
jgi:hypothetical protein